jgi:hypothetical protein
MTWHFVWSWIKKCSKERVCRHPKINPFYLNLAFLNFNPLPEDMMQSHMKNVAKLGRYSLSDWAHGMTFWLMIYNYALGYIEACFEGTVWKSTTSKKNFETFMHHPHPFLNPLPMGHTHTRPPLHPLLSLPPMAIHPPSLVESTSELCFKGMVCKPPRINTFHLKFHTFVPHCPV